jgi:diguanylate cyclase (GGDEF)-like protein
MHNDDDHLALVEDPPDRHSAPADEAAWTLLIVDDDADVHHATEFALHDLRVLGRPLAFLHAFSAAEALAVLERHRDVAVVLLDVVMEREDAGLAAVARIRQELGMTSVRIVLRTGQPGYAPELEAIANYDINDYKTKTELTRSKLFTTITAAIRSFDQIRRLDENRSMLELIVEGASRFNAESGLQSFAATVIEQLAALLGIPVDGMVCARLADPLAAPAGHVVVLAAAGRYRALVDAPLAALADSTARAMITGCLEQRASQRGEHALALYFAGRHGRSFAVYVESGAPLREPDRHLLDIFCANIAICGENVGLVERLRNAAYVDQLTRLPNRMAQIELIDQRCASAPDAELVLALVDIDEFSESIDAFGYQFGDQQLQAVGDRLRAMLPVGVHVARVGSDVFGAYGSACAVNPENLRKILAAPFDNEGVPHTISFSLGLVRAADAPCSGGDLLRNAAIALKQARRDGPGNTAYYTAEVGLLIRQRVHLLHDLRAALASRQLIVAFQPQLDLLTRRVFGVEALLRWRADNGAYVPLEQVIPVAEQSGLIVDIGAWVLARALAVQHDLAAQGYPLRMAVNVSPVQFRQPGFVAMLSDALRAAGSDPAQLELEITESVALSCWKQVADHLAAIRALGVAIAIDDFGTGFSSLSYLARLPADCLKIDRSFIRALDDQGSGTPIAAMVIQLAAQLGLRVLAEGVEDERQLRTLLALGCRAGQGLLYAPALEPDDLLPWLREQARP